MKAIVDDLISSVTTDGGELSATDYEIENVQTDFPTQVWIDDGTITPGSNIVITVNLSADADGIFLFNWLADSIEISVNGGGAYSTPDNDFISDNRFLKQGSDILTKPIWFGTAATSANGYKVRLSTSVDRKDSPAKGNNIYQFDVDTGATGRFEDSSGNTINLKDHAGVMIGSHIDLGGTWHQVTKIIGDGTGSGAVTLSGSPSDNTINEINNPVKIGIIRAGNIETFDNSTVGLQRGLLDFSTRKQTARGLNSFKQSNSKKIYAGSMVSSVTNAESFFEFALAMRSKPFACLIADSMPTAQKENYNFSMFSNFLDLPSETFGGQAGDRRMINFRIGEFL
jgi:hypothetical protein